MNKDSKAICKLTVIPVRKTADDTAEIVTQLLFGELVNIIDLQNQWVKIKIEHDKYKGWVDSKQLLEVKLDTYTELQLSRLNRQQESILTINTPWGTQNVVGGSPILSTQPKFAIDKFHFSWLKDAPLKRSENLIELALTYLNAPYLWGGRTRFGIDCSGFTQTIFHQNGYDLPRDASQQYTVGKRVSLEQQQPGDLAFFESSHTGKIHHVGIVLPDHKIIHAHGRVRIDILDEKGIYNQEEKYYSHLKTSINHLN